MTLTLSTCAAASLSMPMTLTLSTCAAASLSLYSRCGSLVKRTTSHSPSVRAGCGSARMCGLCCLRESVWARPLGILLSAICKCIVEPVSWSSSEVLLPSRCLHRAATALETCSSDSLDPAAAFAGDFAFFEPLLGAGGLAFLELLGGAAAGGAFAFLALVGAAAFAFFALGTGAEAAGVAAVSATLRFFGFSAGVGVAVAGSLTSFHFLGH